MYILGYFHIQHRTVTFDHRIYSLDISISVHPNFFLLAISPMLSITAAEIYPLSCRPQVTFQERSPHASHDGKGGTGRKITFGNENYYQKRFTPPPSPTHTHIHSHSLSCSPIMLDIHFIETLKNFPRTSVHQILT